MATTKNKRAINLTLRQAQVSNLNFSPEKAGKKRVERVDLSLTFIVKDMEIDELVSAKGNPLKLLWHTDGTVMFRELGKFELDFQAEGDAIIGLTDEHLLKFPGAKLKKISITPHIERQAQVKCQIRVDPTGHMEELGQITIQEICVFSFTGIGVEKDDKQKSLDV